MTHPNPLDGFLAAQLAELRDRGTYKEEVVVGSPGATTETPHGTMLNLCANNYLGLAGHPAVVAGAVTAAQRDGAGMASVRFICGTQHGHRDLEREIARFLGYPDSVLYSSCYEANTGLFAPLTTRDDVILSDQLNHASLIDGIRLAPARSVVYRHADLDDLRRKLRDHADARMRFIVTDGVFSMEGDLAPLPDLVEIAERESAVLVVDDSHGVGVIGPTGRGTAEHHGLTGRVDIQTGTFGKALGGAMGGYTVGSQALVDLLRQRSRTYLFSNSVPPPVVGAARAALSMVDRDPGPLDQLRANTAFFRREMARAGFQIPPGEHPIVPVMIGDERQALVIAERLRSRGVLVLAFTHPVVPRGEARIRVQVSAAHSTADLARAVDAFRDCAPDLLTGATASTGPVAS